jgi:hypothetical protein
VSKFQGNVGESSLISGELLFANKEVGYSRGVGIHKMTGKGQREMGPKASKYAAIPDIMHETII